MLLLLQPIPHVILAIILLQILLHLLSPFLFFLPRDFTPPWISGTARPRFLTLNKSPSLTCLTLNNSGRFLALDVYFTILIEYFQQFDDMVSIEVEYLLP